MNEEYMVEKVRDEVIIQLKPVRGKTYADIGAGRGFMSEGLINAGLKVIALDSSGEAVNFLKEKFRDIREFEALITGADKINLNDESVDYACAYMCMQQVVLPENHIKEIFRILKHGGKTAVIDILNTGHAESGNENQSTRHGFSFPDIYSWFLNAGFRNISIEKSDEVIFQSEGTAAEIKLNIFIAFAER